MINRTAATWLFVCLSVLTMASLAVLAQEETTSRAVPSIKAEELKKMIDGKAADFLVVSNDPQESYDEGHIPGAVSFPWATELKMPITLPRNKLLILYCSCAHEEDSTDTASKLIRFGYRNTKVLEGGYLNWMKLKYPIEAKK